MFNKYAEIVFDHSLKQRFTYIIPEKFLETIKVGMRALVIFNKQEEIGLILNITDNALNDLKELSYIQTLPDPIPIVNAEQILISKWMSSYYLCSEGEAIFKTFPKVKSFDYIKTSIDFTPNIINKLNEEQQVIYKKLKSQLSKSTEVKDLSKIDLKKEKEVNINLLYGATGTGKTEIYIHLIKDVLEKNQNALLLVPEISLTVQLIQRLEQVFGKTLALLHSGLKSNVRFENYLKILNNEKKIGVGTRSAIFAPFENLALIILDEEHDQSYKENSSPRYDARQICQMRARIHSSLIVFGSATPRLELLYHAKHKKENIVLHTLNKRAKGATFPDVKIIYVKSPDTIISGQLLNEIQLNLEKKEQTLLLLNRRGFYPQVFNSETQKVETCPSCSVSLSLHNDANLHCHYCGYTRLFTGITETGAPATLIGAGIQKLEDFLIRRFANARIERLDSDITVKRSVLEDTLNLFFNHEIDILLGTQMIARGLDVPNVTLVGVLQAERGFFMPDFRANEKTFSLLTQVAGRAGRDKKQGRVIFECFNINNPYILAAAEQNYEQFYDLELNVRKVAFYPPYSRLIRLLGRGPDLERIKYFMENLSERLHTDLSDILSMPTELQILGPVEAPILKINNKFRIHILIKTISMRSVRLILDKYLKEGLLKTHPKDYLVIDFDPIDLM